MSKIALKEGGFQFNWNQTRGRSHQDVNFALKMASLLMEFSLLK
jgi:hypothetical protein